MKRQIPFGALIAAAFVSNFGNVLTSLAIPWFVLETTGSPSAAGVTAFFGVLPTVLAGLFGGPIIDRVGFKRMSILSDILSGITVALIPLLYRAGWLAFWNLQVLVFLGALLDAPGVTARISILPELSQEARIPLDRANAIQQVANQLATLVGPLVGGVLVAVIGAANVLWVNAATFALSAGFIAFCVPARLVPVPPHAEITGVAAYLTHLKEGFQFIRNDRLLTATMVAAALANFVLGQLDSVLLPTYANQVLHSSTALGTVTSTFAAGALIGAALYGAIGPRVSRRAIYLATWVLQSVSLLGWSFLPPLIVMSALAVLLGLGIGAVNPLMGTVNGQRVPAEMRGRVYGLGNALGYIVMPLGPMIGGFVAEAWGLRNTFLAAASLYFLFSLAQFFIPDLRAMDEASPAFTSAQQ